MKITLNKNRFIGGFGGGGMPSMPKPPAPPSKDQAALDVMQGKQKAPKGFDSTILGDNRTRPTGQMKTLLGE
jgi:hypothetical protein